MVGTVADQESEGGSDPVTQPVGVVRLSSPETVTETNEGRMLSDSKVKLTFSVFYILVDLIPVLVSRVLVLEEKQYST